jgi:hypothetical protein
VTYTVHVQWLEVTRRGYRRGERAFRHIVAASLTDACAAALAQVGERINASVSMCWLNWPQPGSR